MYIIPIGPDCQPALTLRKLNIRRYSYPWDWAFDTKIIDIINVLNDQEFDVKNWDKFKNINYYLPHDKVGDTHGINENLFENTDIIGKYKRRFDRFFKHIKQDNVTIVRFGDDRNMNELKSILPNVNILHLKNGNSKSKETIEEVLKIGIEMDYYYNILNICSYISDNVNHRFGYLFPIETKQLESIIIEIQNELIDMDNIVFCEIHSTFLEIFNVQRTFNDKMDLNYFLSTRIENITGKKYSLF